MRFSLTCLLIAALMVAWGAPARAADSGKGHNRYKWRDTAGNLHYSDALPTEAAKYGYDVIGPQGLVIKHVDRTKTAQEQAAAKTELAAQNAAREQTDAKARQDQQLIVGYPEESDLKRAQQQKRTLLDQQVSTARMSLRSQEQSLADMLARAAETEQSGTTLPDQQAKDIAAMRKQVEEQRATVARRERDREQAISMFDSETARYRELRTKAAEPNQ